MDIVKASGELEKFNKEKIYNSLRKSGIRPQIAYKICKEVEKKIYSGISSQEILNEINKYLQKENLLLAARYNLKKAIMALGPSGFFFEKYIAEIFKSYGYQTEVGKIVKGFCVRHEIDVIAHRKNKHFIIECKYHNMPGIKSDLKVALYTFARFLDIKKAWENGESIKYFHNVFLVTNTKCTGEAIAYSRCAGLKIIGWHYPKNKGLEALIENKRLYPITILPSFSKYIRERLSSIEIILAKDILKYSFNELINVSHLKPIVVKKLQQEAEEIILR